MVTDLFNLRIFYENWRMADKCTFSLCVPIDQFYDFKTKWDNDRTKKIILRVFFVVSKICLLQ